MKAQISANQIPVTYSERPEVNRDYLTFSVPNGWEDVKKITNKVLVYDGRQFTFTGWHSDYNECYFSAPHKGSEKTAAFLFE